MQKRLGEERLPWQDVPDEVQREITLRFVQHVHFVSEPGRRTYSMTYFIRIMFTALLIVTASALLKALESQRSAGVFLLIEGGKYTFNFTDAHTACQSLNATMATAANMEEALQHSLETCKFGWIAEQVAVVPRLTASSKCGNGKTGLVKWNARENQKFGVFCFSASDSKATVIPQTSTSFTSSTPHTHPLTSSAASPSPPPRTTETPEHVASPTSAGRPQVQTLPWPGLVTTSTPGLYFTTRMSFPSHVITSSPAVSRSASSISTRHTSNNSVLQQSERPAKSSSRVSTALIVFSVVFLIVTAAGGLCYYKLKIQAFRSRGPQGDDMEAKMWKHTDLHQHHLEDNEEEEEEAEDRKYSSDIMLCVNPQMRNSDAT
ncbi:lymphatic vessel endothelial hyaluronic receptor 1b isoform X2 [Dunckerocampus dactyliophorus]|uniref:lymphatic vessel endothelial hyaluronic receptor 1b isoform X2 n=1 Tax=Dunckerocampus dactyliophorus TaxID=161453 RepID=UPI002405677E|nr:lymphatic vessel endothelial hyaluronic receptor 1b isoform X2 [Dunckerocampus dactyliophorus]